MPTDLPSEASILAGQGRECSMEDDGMSLHGCLSLQVLLADSMEIPAPNFRMFVLLNKYQGSLGS